MKQRMHIPSPEESARLICKRLEDSRASKDRFVFNWSVNERAIYATHGQQDSLFGVQAGDGLPTTSAYMGAGDINTSNTSNINLPYAFKNLRFIHAQMCANPPAVTAKPATSDQSDRDKAEAADRLVHYARRRYEMTEAFELMTNNTLLYGTGFLKVVWDGSLGEPLALNPDDTIDMEGDISITVPSPWDIFLDPDAHRWSEVGWFFQRISVPYEEACSRWPEHKKLFKALVGDEGRTQRTRSIEERNYNSIELMEYWEKGFPFNGYLGRFAIVTCDGKHMIEKPRPNPHRFKSKLGIEKAELPLFCLTDVDVPSTVWGKSAVDYAINLQDVYNKLLSHTFDAIQAHGAVRMVLPGGQEMEEDFPGNDNWEVYSMTGTQPPHFISPPQLMPDINLLEQSMKVGIDDMMGVNDAMQGKMQRETAGFTMQYAANQGNMVRLRLFNKYAAVTEAVYRTFLKLIRDNWDTERTIEVMGKENTIETLSFSGADVDGGFDLVVEYGTNMSLDPQTRREEIMALMPVFEKAGVPTRMILKMLRLNELSGMYDILELAEKRQKEIFEAIIGAEGRLFIEPEEFEDHENMLAYALYWVMTQEYQDLDEEIKEQIREHIRQRKKMAGMEKAEASGAPMAEGGPQLAPLGADAMAAGAQEGATEPAGEPSDPVTQELMAILGS